jgi:hypothetical protein
MSIKARAICLLVIMSLAPTSAGAALTALADLALKDAEFGEALMEALKILDTDTPCSRFFGGGRKATAVLRHLAARMKKERLPQGVGMRMYGGTTIYQDSAGGGAYRLFDHAAVNAEGPFYRPSRLFLSARPVTSVGGWPANTRGARVLMLLHELGHLIEGPDGGWLLPNDGGDWRQSEQNTESVQKACGEQLRPLR